MNGDLPHFLQDLLNAPPHHGQGVHLWLFRTARYLHKFRRAPEIISLLQTLTKNCGRPVPQREIIAAVRDSMGTWDPDSKNYKTNGESKPIWPARNLSNMRLYARQHTLAELYESSPITVPDDTESTIDILFPQDCLLCCGANKCSFATKSRAEWRGHLHDLALVVPSTMSDIEGLTKDGKPSQHTLNNTGPRRFIVCEFDCGTPDQQASILIHLSQFAPLACVVSSGGKSMHGWFFCSNIPEEKVRKFFAYAVSLGADPPAWLKSQFMRMPDGLRDTGKRQPVFFINPKAIK